MPRSTIEKACPVCGSLFRVAPSRLKHGRGVHCSKACQYIVNKEKLAKPKVRLTCVGCGQEFERAPSHVDGRKGGGKYCTRDCRDANWKGEVTPNWQGGNGVYKRGPNWQSIKRAILKRDNHQCQECGDGGQLHVHHKIPFRMFDDADEANHHDNLISLCPPCHSKEDAKHKWVNTGSAIIRMDAGSYAWGLAREMAANDNAQQRKTA